MDADLLVAADTVARGRARRPVRVAIVADTHGRLDPRVAGIVKTCDMAVHGGDIGDAGILARLEPRGGRVFAVFGNNDVPAKWPEAERHLLDCLPEMLNLALPGGVLSVVHGHQTAARGRHERLRARFPDARAVVYGHSHRLIADRDASPWILNPGAAGSARTYGGASCMVLFASETLWRIKCFRFSLPSRAPPKAPARRP